MTLVSQGADDVEEAMPKVVGPTIPRKQLGEEIGRLRRAAGITEAEVAEKLGCSESKIRKVEAGYVGVNRGDLLVMLGMFGVNDDQIGESLLALQKRGKERGWWSEFGMVPPQFSTFLGLESSATTIRIFEPMTIHGLFQTEDYARAIVSAHTPGITAEEVERQVQIKLARQERVLADPPEVWLTLDEAAIHRVVGGPETMKAQLERLMTLARSAPWLTLQVVPYSHGAYPGQLGAFTMFEFPDEVRSPVVYVEGQAGSLYLERAPDLRRCTLSFTHMTAAALSPPESAKLIAAVARSIG